MSFYVAHMALEEEQILPLAEQVLTDADWVEFDAAFTASRYPLTGQEGEVDYRALFTRGCDLTARSVEVDLSALSVRPVASSPSWRARA